MQASHMIQQISKYFMSCVCSASFSIVCGQAHIENQDYNFTNHGIEDLETSFHGISAACSEPPGCQAKRTFFHLCEIMRSGYLWFVARNH